MNRSVREGLAIVGACAAVVLAGSVPIIAFRANRAPAPEPFAARYWMVGPEPVSCTPRGISPDWLQDIGCSPGVVDASLTAKDVCRPGFATAWRNELLPASSALAHTVKGKEIAAYGRYAGRTFGAYELDHVVPIKLGGIPNDWRNVWAESPATPNRKDAVEAAATTAVCTKHTLSLAEAQAGFETSWVQLGEQLGVHPGGRTLDEDDG